MRGLSESDLAQIETELEIRLPPEFCALHASYPFPESSDARDHELLVNPAVIIEANQYLREHGFFGEPWPNHWFSFGCDGCGNEYFLRLDDDPPLVYFADHESSSPFDEGSPIGEWIEERLEITREVASEERSKAERKWWQVWR